MKTLLALHAIVEEQVNIVIPGVLVHVVETGIGKVNAALTACNTISSFKPDWVLNFGTAGSIDYPVGAVRVCSRFIDRDLKKVAIPGIVSELYFADPFPLFSNIDSTGVCNTGDSFLTEAYGHEGDVFDMEAFAIARVCQSMFLPFLSVKCVSDKIGENSIQHWEDKLAESNHALQRFFNEHLNPTEAS